MCCNKKGLVSTVEEFTDFVSVQWEQRSPPLSPQCSANDTFRVTEETLDSVEFIKMSLKFEILLSLPRRRLSVSCYVDSAVVRPTQEASAHRSDSL